VDSATDTIIENPGEGNDAVYARVSFTVPANVETLSLFGAGLTGTANNQGDELFGDGTNATVLIGGTGNDYMVGGDGNDTIISGGGSDRCSAAGRGVFVFHDADGRWNRGGFLPDAAGQDRPVGDHDDRYQPGSAADVHRYSAIHASCGGGA
jgi:Ca2+-binding RTX toxin-like protein